MIRYIFDRILRKTYRGCHLRYGIVEGNNHIIFIKSGADGTCRGRENKYLRIARNLHKAWGYSVICGSNPADCDASYPIDEAVIRQYAREQGFDHYSIAFIGASDGAYQNLLLAAQFPQTETILAINPSTVSLADFIEKLRALPTPQKRLIYGTLDEEYPNAQQILAARVPRLEILSIHGADHQFTGLTEVLVSLAYMTEHFE